MLASQKLRTICPLALCVRDVTPRSSACFVTPRSEATEPNSSSPSTPTSTPPLSTKRTLPSNRTAAKTRITSRNGMPRIPRKKQQFKV
ncbi:unnamed protein product, partial [Nesidiocoris tenuis]